MFKYIKKLISLFMNKKKEIPTYVVEEAETYAVSLVSAPAIEEEFLLFNKQDGNDKQLLKFADEEHHMVVGAVMIPDKPIYRISEDGEEYNIMFSKESIEKMAIDYMKNYRQYNVTLQHEENASGIWLTEQWLKSDMTNDKSIALGLNPSLPVGTLFQSYYCDSNELWQKLKTGEMTGFSIEAMCDFSKLEKQFKKEEEDKQEQNTIEPVSMTELEEQTPNVETVEAPVVEQSVEQVEQPVQEEVVEETPVVEEQPKVEEPKAEQPKQEEVVEQPKEDPQNEVIANLLEEIKNLREQINELSIKPSTKPVNVQSGGAKGDTYAQWRKQMARFL